MVGSVALMQFACLRLGGKIFANPAKSFALHVVESEEFESVLESLPVTHNRPDFDGIGRKWQRNFQSDDLTSLQVSRQRGPDAVLSEFGGSSPTGVKIAVLKHPHLQPDIQRKARKAPRVAMLSHDWRCG